MRVARCAKARHGAERAEKPSKNNRPTEAHRAPFYLAIVRLLCLPLPLAPSMTRRNTRGCEWRPARSWAISWSGACDDKGRIRCCGRIGWPRRDGGSAVVRTLIGRPWRCGASVGGSPDGLWLLNTISRLGGKPRLFGFVRRLSHRFGQEEVERSSARVTIQCVGRLLEFDPLEQPLDVAGDRIGGHD